MDKKLILIAEDEPAYSKILQHKLEKEGYDVVIASNGDELLKIAHERKSVLIILDLVMPVKNGFQVLTEIKKDEELKKIPIIALSNLDQEEDVQKAKRLGADEYVIKSDETFHSIIYKINKLLL